LYSVSKVKIYTVHGQSHEQSDYVAIYHEH